MKKKTLNIFLLLLTFATFYSCLDEGIPRDRPDIFSADLGDGTDPVIDDPVEEEEEFKRPNLSIIIEPDHCACSQKKPISLGDCVSFCADTPASDNSTFFFSTSVTKDISEANFKDVAGFCTTQVDDPEGEVAVCSIEIKDEKGNITSLPFTPAPGQSSFEIDVVSLAENTTFRVAIVESNSGSRSTTAQLRLSTSDEIDKIGGPLAFMPVSEYSCISRQTSVDSNTGALIIEDANRFHFYFIPESRPEPLRATTLSALYCHDIDLNPTTPINSPLLEDKSGVHTLRRRPDRRFCNL